MRTARRCCLPGHCRQMLQEQGRNEVYSRVYTLAVTIKKGEYEMVQNERSKSNSNDHRLSASLPSPPGGLARHILLPPIINSLSSAAIAPASMFTMREWDHCRRILCSIPFPAKVTISSTRPMALHGGGH